MKPHTFDDMYVKELSHFWFAGKHAFLARVLQMLAYTSPRILDVGCGTGGTTLFLRIWGDVIGVEPNKQAAALARKRGVRVLAGSAEALPLRENSFDIVTILGVLYHKDLNENKALHEAYRVLKPGGTVIVMEPSSPILWNRHDVIMDAKYRYTKKQLTGIICRNSFTVLYSRYIFGILYPIILAVRVFGKFIPPGDNLPTVPGAANSLLTQLLKLEASVFPLLHTPIGSSLLIIARKRNKS